MFKKIFSIVLALTLIFNLGVSCFADETKSSVPDELTQQVVKEMLKYQGLNNANKDLISNFTAEISALSIKDKKDTLTLLKKTRRSSSNPTKNASAMYATTQSNEVVIITPIMIASTPHNLVTLNKPAYTKLKLMVGLGSAGSAVGGAALIMAGMKLTPWTAALALLIGAYIKGSQTIIEYQFDSGSEFATFIV